MSSIGETLRSHEGYCPCCRSATNFTVHGTWLREDYRCDRCGSIPRQRHLITVLDLLYPRWRKQRLHESSPAPPMLVHHSKRYESSQYLPGVPLGSVKDGVRCENIEKLTLKDRSLDLFVTQDVLEHVFRPDLALREIQRTLKPGGAHIFTAPKHPDLAKSRCRAVLRPSGDIEHFLPEEYHGSPVGDGRALVTWDYGSDFERVASNWVNSPVVTYNTIDRDKGIEAEFNEVFVIMKR